MTENVTQPSTGSRGQGAAGLLVMDAASDAPSERIAASLVGTGLAVVTRTEEGAFQCVDPQVAPFFAEYAIRALNTADAAMSAETRYDDRIPGVLIRTISSPTAKRGGRPATLLLARRESFDVRNEDVQRWCSRLAIDAAWLSAEADRVPALSPMLLSRLGDLAATAAHAETKIGGLHRELDSLSSQLSDTYEELTLIYQVSSGMRVNRTVDDFFLQACTDVIDVMGVRGAAYAVTDPNGRVSAAAQYGDVDLSPALIDRLMQDVLVRFDASSRPILLNAVAGDATFAGLGKHVSQLVAVPIQRAEKLLGALVCFDKLNGEFTTQDSKLLNSIANETAIYLENQTLFSDARGLMMGLMHALTSAVDAKDTYTCGHSQRVALFARETAKLAGLPDALCERVYMAGLLHDVGKIGVPEEVLRKPGKLTDGEFEMMKKHVEIGARILKDVAQIVDLIPGVLYHHERYDGKGYPHNLAGQEIPLIARILCVADCFDAMTSNRTYRKALPIEVALLEIRRCAGTQFDPQIADAFLSLGAARLRELIESVTEQTAIRMAA